MSRPLLTLVAVAGLLTSGCFSFHRAAPRPGITQVGSKPVTVPGRLLGNVLGIRLVVKKRQRHHINASLVRPD